MDRNVQKDHRLLFRNKTIQDGIWLLFQTKWRHLEEQHFTTNLSYKKYFPIFIVSVVALNHETLITLISSKKIYDFKFSIFHSWYLYIQMNHWLLFM